MVKSYRYPKSSHANIDDKHDVAKYKHLNALVQFDLITIVPMITCSFTRWLSNCTIFVWNNNEKKRKQILSERTWRVKLCESIWLNWCEKSIF